MRIGNRIAILKDGRLIQVGTPQEILSKPADEYVNRFVQRRLALDENMHKPRPHIMVSA